MTNRIFFADLYGYDTKEYNNKIEGLDPKEYSKYIQEVNNCGEYIDCDYEGEYIKDGIENYEKDGKTITEIFLKTRILKGDPLFDYLKNGGLVKIIHLDPNQNNND